MKRVMAPLTGKPCSPEKPDDQTTSQAASEPAWISACWHCCELRAMDSCFLQPQAKAAPAKKSA
jgi:hypothetical protein